MTHVQRKVTYRLYPNATQNTALETACALHCRLYNALLEEHHRHYEAGEKAFSFARMCAEITQWRRRVAALRGLNAQSLQVTAKRVALAFDAFFRRVKAGETPGYPRFKAFARYPGFGFKTHGDGWKLGVRAGTAQFDALQLTGIGRVPMRGKSRFSGTPKTCEILRKGDKWYASVTFNVAPDEVARTAGTGAMAFDWGVKTLLTIARDDGGVETVDNPRWLKRRLEAIKALQRVVSEEEAVAKRRCGLDPDVPLAKGQRFTATPKLKRLYRQVAALHGKIARQRKDFYHKLTAALVARFGAIGTEALAPQNMTKAPKAKPDPERPGEFLPNGAAAKAGLNRGILDAAPSLLLGMLRTKAEEAGSWFALANTRQLKPTQRCHGCGKLVKKTLNERTHRCDCGCVSDRDENAAKTLLRWMMEGDFWSGTGQAGASPSETPPTAALAV